MAFPYYYPVVPSPCVNSPVLSNNNVADGYKWYQSCPSSDVMAASPCLCGCQSSIPQIQVGTPKPYYTHEYEPPPVPLSFTYTSQGSNSQLLDENRNNYSAYKLFDTSSEREFVFASPYTLKCHTTLSTGQLYYGIESTHPLTTPCSTSPSMFSDKYECHEALQISEADVILGDGSKLVDKVVEVRKELVVDDKEVETQLFGEIPVRNSNSLDEKVSGDALDITTQGTDKIIQTTDRILLQMEEIKHLLLAMYPSSKRGEVITTHKDDPTPVDGDPLVIPATEVGVAPLGNNFEFRTTNTEESLLQEEVKASNLKGAVKGILEDVFDTGSSLKELEEIGNTKMIENFVRIADERLGADSLFIENYRVEIVGDMLAIDSVGVKESRDKNGKEGGVADEEEVLVPINSAEQSFTAHTFANGLDKWYASTGYSELNFRVFSVNSMSSGLAQEDQDSEAMKLFQEMRNEGFDPDETTVVIMLPICARLGGDDVVGEWIHSYAKSSGLFLDFISVGNSLIDYYCKRGVLERACSVFRDMPRKNVVSWNAMISGQAFNGNGERGIALFDEMINEHGVTPNDATFVGALTCCSQAGLIKRGGELLSSMVSIYGIHPKLEHYGCVVDLLGRGGCVKEAYDLTNAMPIKPNAAIWGSLLNACRHFDDIELAVLAAKELIKVEPWNSGNYVLLSNLYAEKGHWTEVENIRLLMKKNSLQKEPGQSMV